MLCHINMQVIGVRRVSARTKHGREPSACRTPDRVNDQRLRISYPHLP